MLFEFVGDITIIDQSPSSTNYGARYSQIDLVIEGVEDDGSTRGSLLETVGKLSVNHKAYMGTQTTDFDSIIKVKTNINHQGYSTATGHSYYGMVMQKIDGRWGENYLSTNNHKFQIRQVVSGANYDSEAIAHVNGKVKIYGKKGF